MRHNGAVLTASDLHITCTGYMLVHLQVEGGHCKIIDLVGLRLAVDGPYDPQFGPALAYLLDLPEDPRLAAGSGPLLTLENGQHWQLRAASAGALELKEGRGRLRVFLARFHLVGKTQALDLGCEEHSLRSTEPDFTPGKSMR